MKMRFIRLLFLATVSTTILSASAIELGTDWEIVIPDEDPNGVRANLWGLTERFARDLKEATGLTLPVRFAANETHPGHAIYVGTCFAEKAGVLPPDMRGWSNGIAERGGNIYFFGRDAAGRKFKKGEWPSQKHMVLPSARAMTRFMYRFLGIRFVMPGDVGRAIPKRKTVTVPDGYSDREDPEFEFMAGRVFQGLTGIGRGHFGSGRFHTYGGHTYPSAVSRALFADHPAYFALRGGKRRLGETFGHTAVCISNPEVRKLITDELLRRFDAGAAVCQLAQNDGDASCQCENCRALYGTDDWGEKLWRFHRDIAEDILRLRPGKIVHILCYGQTGRPPKGFRKFPANVMIELCTYGEEAFRAWKDYDVPHGFTVYTYLWGEYPLPGLTPKRSFAGLASVVRRLRDNRVRGIFRCGFGELPGLEGPAYYLFDRLLEDRTAQIDATLTEFCEAAFGREAAGPMKRFYRVLDSRLRMFDKMSMGHFEADAPDVSGYLDATPRQPLDLLAYFYTPATLGEMEGALRRAEASASLTDRERIRLKRVRTEFDYAANLGRIAVLHAGYQAAPSAETFAPLARELQWRTAFIERLYDAKGNIRRLKDWPEDPLFGGVPKAMLRANGRLGAAIGAPLDWDAGRMLAEGYHPGASADVAKWKAHNAAHGLKPLAGPKPYPRDLAVRLTARPDGRGFSFETVPGVKDTRITVVGRPASGDVKPGRRYRVSCFVRYEDVTPPSGQEGGFCMNVQVGPGASFCEPAMRSGLTGSSDWRHLSRTFTAPEKPWGIVEVIFRLYDSQGRVEVEDVTVEELDRPCGERSSAR